MINLEENLSNQTLEDILHMATMNSYEAIKDSNFEMDGLEKEKRLIILENFIKYFEKYEYFEICEELKNEILKLKI